MWLVTTQGFYSAVAHRTSDDHVIVRARTREDIEALRRQIPEIEPFEDPDADYRHRAVVTRAEWVSAVAQLASEIDYDNFKNAVAARQGHERAAVYAGLWADLLELQKQEAPGLMTDGEARKWLARLSFRPVNLNLTYNAHGERDENGASCDPHEYVILGWPEVQQPDFDRFVKTIRARGYEGEYRPPYAPDRSMVNDYLVIDGWAYWYIDPNMLNRCRVELRQHTPLPK